MKRWMLIAAAGAGLASCEEPAMREIETQEPPIEAPVAPAATDQAASAAATGAATDAPPTDMTTLPPEQRPSEETVQPESETLFY